MANRKLILWAMPLLESPERLLFFSNTTIVVLGKLPNVHLGTLLIQESR